MTEVCPITLDPIVDYVQFGCGHKFSSDSIKRIILTECESALSGTKHDNNKFNCPMCRKPFLPSFYYNSATMVIPLPICKDHFGSRALIDEVDVSFAMFVFGCFSDAVKSTTLKESNGAIMTLRNVQYLYQMCSHTFTKVSMIACMNKADGENMDETRQCQSAAWEAMKMADKTLLDVESSFSPAGSAELHSLNNTSEVSAAIFSFVNTMNTLNNRSMETNDWVYGDTGEYRRPVYQDDVLYLAPDVITQPDADSSGPSSPRLLMDDGEDAVFFICSKCNALCDSYTESAPALSASEASTSMCFSCWQSMVNERVDQLEDSEFNLP